jgi:general secretion pathway protein D
VLAGVPGLSDIPLVGHMFASNHHETLQTDIILTLTPHIIRVLDLSEGDLRAFRVGRNGQDLLPEVPPLPDTPPPVPDTQPPAPASPVTPVPPR